MEGGHINLEGELFLLLNATNPTLGTPSNVENLNTISLNALNFNTSILTIENLALSIPK